MKKIRNIACMVTLLLMVSFLFGACNKEEESTPPQIKVYVNNEEVSAEQTVSVIKAERVEYRFEVAASSTITDIKTVISDVSNPESKKNREVLVAGLANSLNETVKGVLFPTYNLEMMLVVKDIDGNEATKVFTILVQ